MPFRIASLQDNVEMPTPRESDIQQLGNRTGAEFLLEALRRSVHGKRVAVKNPPPLFGQLPVRLVPQKGSQPLSTKGPECTGIKKVGSVGIQRKRYLSRRTAFFQIAPCVRRKLSPVQEAETAVPIAQTIGQVLQAIPHLVFPRYRQSPQGRRVPANGLPAASIVV